MPTTAVGKVAPEFRLPSSNGETYSLKEALAQGPVLAAFFKVGCPCCQFTLPFVERLYRQFSGVHPRIWGISQDSAADSRRLAEEFGLTFPILIDEKPYAVSKQYGLQYVPTLVLIAPDGHIELSGDGFSKSDLIEIHKYMSAHYAIKPPVLFQPDEQIPQYKPG